MTPVWPGTLDDPTLVRSRWAPMMVRAKLREPDEWIVHEFFGGDEYSLHRLPAGIATIIDVGAHIGAAVLAMRCVFPRAEIVALEGDEDNARVLRANTARDPLCTPLWRAASIPGVGAVNFIRTVPSECHEVRDGTAVTAIGHVGAQGDPRGVMVPATSVQAIMAERGWSRLDLLKLDCEGSEWTILPSLDPRCIGYVVGEWHGWEPFQAEIPRWEPTHKVTVLRRNGGIGTWWFEPRQPWFPKT